MTTGLVYEAPGVRNVCTLTRRLYRELNRVMHEQNLGHGWFEARNLLWPGLLGTKVQALSTNYQGLHSPLFSPLTTDLSELESPVETHNGSQRDNHAR